MKISQEESVDYQEDISSLLSTKMLSLQLRTQQHPSQSQQSIKVQVISTKSQPQQVASIIKNSRIMNYNFTSKKLKIGSIKASKSNKRQRYKKGKDLSAQKIKKKGIKLFEVFRSNQPGRRSNIKQVTDTPVSSFTGNGILALPTGKKYEGEWVEGTLIGKVKITQSNGNVYIGQVYEYQKHGMGEYHFQEGTYIGQFSGSDFHGQGILYNKQGNIEYDGMWRRGKRWLK